MSTAVLKQSLAGSAWSRHEKKDKACSKQMSFRSKANLYRPKYTMGYLGADLINACCVNTQKCFRFVSNEQSRCLGRVGYMERASIRDNITQSMSMQIN